jgi:1,4-dihydroxy-2-naphthoate octaprenyltransferase
MTEHRERLVVDRDRDRLWRWRMWLHAARPATLPAAIVPVVVGTAVAVAAGHFRLFPFMATLFASLFIQNGTNFANDLFDFQKGVDTVERIGPMRITASGLASPTDVLRATILAFGLAALAGGYLIYSGGVPIFVIGLTSIISGIAYTAGPYPLGYHGLGDLFAFLFFGPVAVLGTYYLQSGHVSIIAGIASIPVGLLVTAILIVNNIRDIDTDRLTGKMTLAVRLGRRATQLQYATFVFGAYVVPVVLLAAGATSWLFWLPFLTLPKALHLVETICNRSDGPALNAALKGTGQLHLLFGLLFAASFLY